MNRPLAGRRRGTHSCDDNLRVGRRVLAAQRHTGRPGRHTLGSRSTVAPLAQGQHRTPARKQAQLAPSHAPPRARVWTVDGRRRRSKPLARAPWVFGRRCGRAGLVIGRLGVQGGRRRRSGRAGQVRSSLTGRASSAARPVRAPRARA